MAKTITYNIEFQGADEQIKKLAEIEKAQAAIKKEIKATETSGKELSEADRIRLARQKEALREQQKAARDVKKEIDLQKRATQQAGQTLDQMRARLAMMRKEAAQIPIGTKAFNEQAKAINELNEEVKVAEQAMGQFQRNVGNYNEAANIASMSVNEMRREIRALRDMPVAGRSTEEVQQMNKRIGELNDAMVKLRQEQESQGMDAFQAYAGSMQAVTSAAQVLGGTLNILGIESKVFAGLQKNIMELIGISQALATVERLWHQRVLQRTASLIKGTVATVKDTIAKTANSVSTSAAAKAEAARATMLGKGTIASKAAAAATWLWNAALAANPIVLITAGVAGLTAGVIALTRALRRSKDDSDELRRSNEALIASYEAKEKKLAYEIELLKALGASQGEIVAMQKEMMRAELARMEVAEQNALQQQRLGKITIDELKEVQQATTEAYQRYNIFMAEQIRLDQESREKKKENTEAIKTQTDALKAQNEALEQSVGWWQKQLELIIKEGEARAAKIQEGVEKQFRLPTAEEEAEEVPVFIKQLADDMAYVNQIFEESYAGRKQKLDEMLAAGLIGEKRYAAEVAKLDAEVFNGKIQGYQAVVNAARKGFSENAKAQRVLSIFEQGIALRKTIADIQAGFARTAGSAPFPINIPLIAGFAAQVAGLVNSIKQLKTPTPPTFAPVQFAKGGIVGGKSHSQGGTKYFGEDGNVVELERGELFTVVNKHDTPMLSMLSEQNSRHGRKFAEGGIVNNTAGLPGGQFIDQIIKAVGSIPVVIVESDITQAQQRAVQIKSAGNL